MNQLTKRQKELLHDEDVKAIAIQFAEIAVQKKDNQVFYIDRIFNSFASQFEEKKKDWEIISYKNMHDGIHIRTEDCTRCKCDIHSVKYKDQVFTIGDETDKGKIGAFVLRESELKVHLLHGALFDISEVKKVERKVRFTTNGDNENVFVGDKYYYISSDNCYLHTMILVEEHLFKPNLTYFKSKEKAEEYILLNSPKLSVNECVNQVVNELNQWAYFGEDPKKLAISRDKIQDILTSLVKSKSK